MCCTRCRGEFTHESCRDALRLPTEIDLARGRAESLRVDREIYNPNDQPPASGNFGNDVQIPPDDAAEGGSEQ